MNATAITSAGGRRFSAEEARPDWPTPTRSPASATGPWAPSASSTSSCRSLTYAAGGAGAGQAAGDALRGVVGFATLVVLATPLVAFLSGLFRYDRLGLVAVRGRGLRRGRRVGRHRPAAAAVPPVPPRVRAGRGQLAAAGGRHRARRPPAAEHAVRLLADRRRTLPGASATWPSRVLAASAIVVATGPIALRRRRWPRGRGRRLRRPRGPTWPGPSCALALTFVIDGYPAFGSDVGGVLATAPAFALVDHPARRLAGERRARCWPSASGPCWPLVGARRPRPVACRQADRTHLGRFAQRARGRRRRDRAPSARSRPTCRSSPRACGPGWCRSAWPSSPSWPCGGPASCTDCSGGCPASEPACSARSSSACSGFALNDSGVAVPAMMFGIVLPWVIWLLLRTEPGP